MVKALYRPSVKPKNHWRTGEEPMTHQDLVLYSTKSGSLMITSQRTTLVLYSNMCKTGGMQAGKTSYMKKCQDKNDWSKWNQRQLETNNEPILVQYCYFGGSNLCIEIECMMPTLNQLTELPNYSYVVIIIIRTWTHLCHMDITLTQSHLLQDCS